MQEVKVLELFAGYGGGSFALGKAGIKHKVVGFSEIDKFAIKLYQHNFPMVKNFGDIKNINADKLPDFDLLLGGFPCQSFSIAGKRLGFDDERGNLIFDVLRIAKIKKPSFMLLENVKGLVSHNKGETLKIIISELEALGYFVKYKVLNSKFFGTPQSRPRLYIFCSLNKVDFEFPYKQKLNYFVENLLDEEVEEKYFIENPKFLKRIYDKKRLAKQYSAINPKIAITLLTRHYDNWDGNFIQTEDGRTRKLTEKESFRLMGFFKDEIKINVSMTQCYKLAGNGWDINLVSQILENIPWGK
jgi:DNA (cytosine-5)-methyltransferase 1